MYSICGADGCGDKWIAVTKDLDSGRVSWRCATRRELFYGEPVPQIIALDIPIGLPEFGARGCDREARQLLGRGRASSVFPALIRPLLAATDHADACEKRLQVDGKRMSLQAWAIVPKIGEIDSLLREDPELRTRVREVHPEVSFYFLAGGRPMRHGKKSRAGREERRVLLEPVFGHWLSAALEERRKMSAAEDDVLDAFVALWTAERIAHGQAQTIPAAPPVDACGLRMEIVA